MDYKQKILVNAFWGNRGILKWGKSMSSKEQITTFENYPEGCILISDSDKYWIKPEQSERYHLEHMLVSLISGKVVHFSRAGKLTVICRF